MIPNNSVKYLSEERGAALIIALLLMVVLTVLGTGGLITSTTDIKISSNYRTSQEIFHAADGGIEITKGIIDRAISQNGVVSDTADTQFVQDINFPLEAMVTTSNYDFNDSIDNSDPQTDPDVQTAFVDIVIPLQGVSVAIDVDVTPRRLLGFSIEFASAYEGIGGGVQGGIARFYRINSGAQEASSTSINSSIEAEYRRMF